MISLVEAQNVILVLVAVLVVVTFAYALGFPIFPKFNEKLDCNSRGQCWVETADFTSHIKGDYGEFAVYYSENESVDMDNFEDMCIPRGGVIRNLGDESLILKCSENGRVIWFR